MYRCFLRSKIHLCRVTESRIDYEGSITIDPELLSLTGIKPYEQVSISNLSNGERFETYVIEGKPGEICLNGPTAFKGQEGDRLIIFCYTYLTEDSIDTHKPVILIMDENNNIVRKV